MSRLLFIAILVLGCTKAKSQPEPGTPEAAAKLKYDNAVERYMAGHLNAEGYTFSFRPDGSLTSMGEGLLWSSVALGALPCDKAKVIADKLTAQSELRGGAIRRFEPMPDDYLGREMNFDEATGYLYGVTAFRRRCPDLSDKFEFSYMKHRLGVKARSGELYPNSDEYIPQVYWYNFSYFDHVLGIGDEPRASDLREMEKTSAAWAWLLHAGHKSCYRAHLAWLHLKIAENMGLEISDHGRDEFCSVTRGMDIPLIDQWCGRNDLAGYIDNYQYNLYEYRHQRCGPPWENPDAHDETTPGLDLITAIKTRYPDL